ncbi:Flp pilus assembly protein TadD, contains TPR repeats [Lentzea xinjiangensis]|uniref:Flp pilus assembly protein TadD, contains TPR repeats n=1 Tax=Lentzea xinjiangensis TaxID=402600 RepID=A0A1H9K173_9PSEU|nr:tetratricopeptide repeat protein [Lentzea xinjiangensis]SEQ92673.1 Flp pilus assembly protein TadD, contains TPR repeats [Lentzea xinjiangensis]
MDSRYWIRADRRRDRAHALAELDLPPVWAVVDAHRRLRGPYTAAGSLLRRIADDLLERCPRLGERHNIELLTSTPELAGRVPSAWHTLEWAVQDSERTRYYSRLHTRNIANGLAEVLRDYLAALGGGPRTLVIENAHEADPSDQEFVAVLLRRGDLPGLTVVVGTNREPLADPRGEIDVSLARTIAAHAHVVEPGPAPEQPAPDDAAQAYVDSDGTGDDPRLLAAYLALPGAARAALHDARAEVLARSGEFSLHLGAIPYHLEHGSDPAGAGARALRDALDHCHKTGLYQAAADLGLRGRAVADREGDAELWWHLTFQTGIVLAAVGRADEAEALYAEGRAASQDPAVHLELAYSTAMLHARHYPEPQRDYVRARAWMNLAIAIASQLSDPKKEAFQSVFTRNGLALVEVREQRPEVALALVEEGMARLDRELEPHEHALHRLVLRYNRAQVYGAMGRLEEALADYTHVLERDPNFPEHHFNVGNILRRLGRDEEAITAYREALRLSPPFPEAYYNIGDARLALGDVDGALADFAYVVELDPRHVDARINLAGLLLARGDVDRAWREVTAALELAPDNAHLLCLKGQLLVERDEHAAASEALAEAVLRNEELAEAWAVRGTIAVASGDLGDAISYLSRAITLDDNPEVRYNRAVAYEESGELDAAIADYDAVLAVTDDEDARHRRELCAAATAG